MDRSIGKFSAYLRKGERLLLWALATIPLAGQAQELNSVSGKVVSQGGEPLMGNVVALSVKDSSFLKGNTFIEGDFELSALKEKDVLIKLTSLQFKDTLFHVSFAEKASADLGVIVVNDGAQELDAVEIVGSVPLFSTRPDGVLQVNVANTVLATSNSVSEILSRSPNITTDDEGIAVFGKGLAILYLNGKRIPPERLTAISASQVKNIEIIANPPAIYDAEGRAVINIITRDDLQDGYRATTQQQVMWSGFGGAQASTMLNMNYKKRKIDIAGNYDLKLGDDRQRLITSRIRQAKDDYLNSQVRWDQDRAYKNASNYSLGASYDLGRKGYASLEYNGSYERIDDQTQSRNHIVTDDDNGLYTSLVSRAALIRNNSLTMNLNSAFDSLGSSFFAGGQLSQYRSALYDNIIETNVVNDQEVSMLLQSRQDGEITIFNPQADFVKIFAGGSKLGIGAKLSYASALSGLRFYRSVENDYQVDLQRSNDFEYEETVPAAYIQYDGTFSNSITYGLGLRTEWTRYTLHTTAQNLGTFKSAYVNLFPNAQLNVTLSEQLKVRASYTSRITRPPYQALSPSLVYQDAFTSVEGNPNLLPEKNHSFELGAAFKMFDVTAGYNYTIDPVSGAALRGADEKSYVLKRINLSKGHSFFTTVSASLNTRWLSSVNTVSMSYTSLTTDDYEYEQVGERPQVYAYTSNKINVGNAFTLHVLAWYLGRKYYSLRYEAGRSVVTVGVEKELFRKFLKCSLTANDIFFHSNFAGRYAVGNTLILYDRAYNTSYYRLALTCTFGQLKKASYKSKSTGEAENSRAK